MTAIFDALSEPVARRVAAGLSKIGLALRSRAWKGAGPAGVTPTQGQALAFLRDAPAGLKLGALASLLGVSAPTASDTVNALAAKNLVLKTPGPDKRSLTLKLTAQGESLAGHADEWPAFLAEAIDVLPPAEQAGFLRSLVKIVRTLQKSGDIPVQRLCVTCRFFQPYAHEDGDSPHHCGFVDAAFGDRHLRLNCKEQEAAPEPQQAAAWDRFVQGEATPA